MSHLARYPMPSVLSPVVDLKTGKLTTTWVNYFKAIEELAGRVSAFQDEVAGGASLADLITAFNALTAAMQDASQQETS